LDGFGPIEGALVVVEDRDFHDYRTAMPAISIK